jgi:hypothetical protein
MHTRCPKNRLHATKCHLITHLLARFTYQQSADPALTEDSFLQFVASEAERSRPNAGRSAARYGTWRNQHR